MADAKWAADERKLQPAFEDAHSNRLKPAQSALTSFLKKHPRSQPALILKAFILEKQRAPADKVIEAYRDVARLSGELSGRGAWWCALTLRNLQRQDLILELHQSRLALHPDSLELGEQVFLSSVACWDVDTMVKTSRKMFNAQKSSVWARVAAWAEWVAKAPQPTPTTYIPEPAPARSLLVATTLLSTTGPQCPTSESFWLRVQVLLSAGMTEQAWDVLKAEGGEGSLARVWVRLQAVGTVAERLHDRKEEVWRTEGTYWVGRLRGDKELQRNYAFYRHVLDAVAHCADLVDDVEKVFKELEESVGKKERAPLLALLELDSRRTDKMETQEWSKAVELYWTRWGAKGSVLSELEGVIAGNQAKEGVVRTLLEKRIREGHNDEQTYRELVNAEVLLLRLHPEEWQPADEDVERIWQLYIAGLQYGKNLPKTDVQPADPAGLAAVHLLLLQYHAKSTEDPPLLQAVACSRYITSKSPSCAQAHFLLIRLFRLIGAPDLLASHVSALKPSEIQLDNLLHVLFERGAHDAVLGQTRAVFVMYRDKAEAMYRKTAIDAPEYVKQSLEHETYSKIHGLRDLASSIDSSVSRAVLAIESARLSILSGDDVSEEVSRRLLYAKEKGGGLRDLRNWELMPSLGGGKRRDLRELTGLGGEVGREWIAAWAGMLEGLGRWSRGDEIELGDLGAGIEGGQGTLPGEDALISATNGLLRRAIAASKPGDGSRENGEANGDDASASDVIALFAAVSQPSGSRWSLLYSASSLVEFRAILSLISKRVGELSKGSGGGKKKKVASPGLAGFASELKALRDSVDKRMKKLAEEGIAAEAKADGERDWRGVMKGLVEDESFVADLAKEVSDGRKMALDNVKAALLGKAK